MSVQKFLLKDSSGKKSTTVTVFILGAIVVNLKLILSGITLAGITFGEFSGVDYGASLSALGGVYILRRYNDKKPPEEELDEDIGE